MKKAILISIKPEWVEKILNGEKTIEIRKTMPNCELPIDVYIYCTKEKPYLLREIENKNNIFLALTSRSDCHNYDTEYGMNCEYERECCDSLNGKVVAKFTLNEISNIYASRQGCGRLNNPEDFEWFYSLGLVADDKNSSVYSQDYGVKTEKWSCLSQEELHKYLKYKNGYAWHIDNREIFDKPKELSEFKVEKERKTGSFSWIERSKLTKAPQSWCYVEVE